MRPSHARTRGPLTGVTAVLLVTLCAATLPTPQAAAIATPAPAAAAGAGQSCAGAATFEPEPAGEAIKSRDHRAAVREVNDLTAKQMRGVEADPAAWVDACGAVFYVEPATDDIPSGAAGARTAAAAAPTPPDVLALSSRPGSNRTIYLDFTGDTTTGTAWNTTSYGDPIISAPYSLNAPADTNFDAEERAEIFAAWRSVAEDFAPFDVNVTTAEPSPDALTRTSSSDPTYGTRSVITGTNVIGDGCGCGGMAYLGTFDLTGAQRYQPAWVFAFAAGRTGVSIAQAISHEVGHNFGLSHDGNATNAYDSGSDGWAPIMGASYSRRVSQWSSGEYPGANNQQDDVTTIAARAPTVADDHADSPTGATVLTDGTPLTGVLATRTDTDAFTFTATGKTYLSVQGPHGISNTDLSLRVLDAAGQQIGASNPTRPGATAEAALHADWSVTLPAEAGTYTALVDGVGFGSPATPGGYSDYGSLGAYAITLSATDPTPPLSLTATTSTVTTRVGQALAPTRFVAPQGGHPPYTYTAAIIPSGLSFDTGGHLFGTPDYPGSRWLTITVTDSYGDTASTELALVIEPAAPVNPTDPNPDNPDDTDDTDDTDAGDAGDAGDDNGDVDPAPKFRTRHLPHARHGVTYRATVRFTGPTHTKVRVRGLPKGLTVESRSKRLIVRGKPKAAGVYRVKAALTVGKVISRRTYTLRVR